MANHFVTRPEGLVAWDVKRCTTDKLEEVLNENGDGVTVELIQHVGGRDWVVIARTEFADADEVAEQYGD